MASVAPPIDPNWLLSTTAMSSAALVAIIGGLLVSRVIAIASERQALRRRAHELSDLVRSTEAQADELRHERLEAARYVFAENQAERILFEGIESIDELLDEFFPAGGERADLVEAAPRIISTMRQAHQAIESASSRRHLPRSARALREMGINVSDEDVWIYLIVAEMLMERARRRTVGIIPISQVGRPFRDIQADRERDEGQIRARAEGLRVERLAVEQEAKRLEGTPRGVMPGIAVLSVFGLLGILFPLLLMTRRPVDGSPGARLLVFLAFVLGFVTLLGYLIWAVTIMPKDKQERAAS